MYESSKEPPLEKKEERNMTLIEPRPEDYQDFLQARIWQAEKSLKCWKELISQVKDDEKKAFNITYRVIYENKDEHIVRKSYTLTFMRKDYEVAKWLLKQLKKGVKA